MDKISERLRELRLKNDLSYEKLSKLTGISRSALCRYENGQTDIKAEQIILLARLYKVTADYLLGLED